MRRGGFDSESSSDEAEMAASKQSKEEAMHACELGVRFPLFVMTLRRPELHHRASAKRLRGKGHEGRQLFNVWLLRDVRSKAVEELPLLQNLLQIESSSATTARNRDLLQLLQIEICYNCYKS